MSALLHLSSLLLFFLPSSICLFIILFLFYFVLLSDSGLLEFSEPGRAAVSASERWKDLKLSPTRAASFLFFNFFLKQVLYLLHICKGQGCSGSAYQSFPPAGTERGSTKLTGRNRLYQFRFLEHKSLCNIIVKVSGVLNK